MVPNGDRRTLAGLIVMEKEEWQIWQTSFNKALPSDSDKATKLDTGL